MNNTILKRVLEKSIERELAEYDNAPEHKFSLKHRIAMKRIFKWYEKNTRKTMELSVQTMPHYGLKQKVIFALVIVILMTLITGWFFPLHRITEPQINWLRSRYDFPNMKIYIPDEITFETDDPSVVSLGSYSINSDYLDFLSALEELGIYTAEEVNKVNALHSIPVPQDTRPDSFKNETRVTVVIYDHFNETPLRKARDNVSYLEDKIEYYTERSKDKARAVEGDAEFAADIRDNYLPFHKGFLELIEKLYAERPSNDDSSETLNDALLNLDKDDRRYLSKINELEKC